MPVKIEELAGYIEHGLDDDLQRWFPDAPRVEVPASTPPVAPFLARLPPDAAAALAAFDRRARSGAMAEFMDIDEDVYGFDFYANDCQILDTDYETQIPGEDIWSLAADGGGNHYVVLPSGRVAVWFHEEEVIEADTQYDNLDVFMWCLVRYRAVRTGVLDLASVEPDFRALAQPGALAPEIGLLAYLS